MAIPSQALLLQKIERDIYHSFKTYANGSFFGGVRIHEPVSNQKMTELQSFKNVFDSVIDDSSGDAPFWNEEQSQQLR
jgi:hypothetical protein